MVLCREGPANILTILTKNCMNKLIVVRGRGAPVQRLQDLPIISHNFNLPHHSQIAHQ